MKISGRDAAFRNVIMRLGVSSSVSSPTVCFGTMASDGSGGATPSGVGLDDFFLAAMRSPFLGE